MDERHTSAFHHGPMAGRSASINGRGPAAAKPTLAALFAEGPFARLEHFEGLAVREHVSVGDSSEFGP